MRIEYFQLIDRIVDLDTDARTVKVEATVPTTSTIFEGHFPGRPIMPGVLLVESMAQASGWLIVAINKFERMPFLVAIKDAKLRSFIEPGERIDIAAQVLHEGSGYTMTQAAITARGKRACTAQLMFSLVPFPNAEFRGYMEAMAERVGLPLKADPKASPKFNPKANPKADPKANPRANPHG
jgi:3-hydroxyacyl-[acyl-carrier-protein] dehydratase